MGRVQGEVRFDGEVVKWGGGSGERKMTETWIPDMWLQWYDRRWVGGSRAPLRTTNELPDLRDEDVHGRHRLAVGIEFHVKGFDALGIIRHDGGSAVHLQIGQTIQITTRAKKQHTSQSNLPCPVSPFLPCISHAPNRDHRPSWGTFQI